MFFRNEDNLVDEHFIGKICQFTGRDGSCDAEGYVCIIHAVVTDGQFNIFGDKDAIVELEFTVLVDARQASLELAS